VCWFDIPQDIEIVEMFLEYRSSFIMPRWNQL
jgi:hypothetical protein